MASFARSLGRIATCIAVGSAWPAGAEPTLGSCGSFATAIHRLQGEGRSSPHVGEVHEVEGNVVGRFPGLGGFFVQEEDADADADPATSEGIFVFTGGLEDDPAVGESVRVRGRVSEFFGLTELSAIEGVRACPATGPTRPSPVALPVTDASIWERVEGMHVQITGDLVVTGLHGLERFGEVELAAGERLGAPTQLAAPGAASLALADTNGRRRLLLDDGSDRRAPLPTPYLDRPDGGTLRVGDRLEGVEGVLDFGSGRFRLHPTGPVRFRSGPPRPDMPPEVAGSVRLVAWNLENHLNGDGQGGGFPTRGPRSVEEWRRQRAKIVATLVRLDPDVAALVELENDGSGSESALGQLAEALNEATLGAPYALVAHPNPGAHPIAVGLLYRPNAVAPIGPASVLDARAHPAFDDGRHRPSLAQRFVARQTGERFTAVVSHWKSKGSSCAGSGDPDRRDGQGECNGTRLAAAGATVEWLASDPTGGDAPAIVVGDLNAYSAEDPVRALVSAGYVDLLDRFAGRKAHTFVFDGAAGRLDHALAHADLAPLVAGAGVWHTNADEPTAFDYRTDHADGRFAADPFRASDHDPVLVGLFPDADGDGLADARDACPVSVVRPTVVLGACDSGVPDRVDATGCTLTDALLALRDQETRRGRFMRAVRRQLAANHAIERVDAGAVKACAARWRDGP